jgi:1,2-phenylacetyl-CoA epoxidase PaaB subunit
MPHEPKALPRWEIYIARAKAKHLGTVEAADAEAAIEVAAKEFKEDPKRLMAVRRA